MGAPVTLGGKACLLSVLPWTVDVFGGRPGATPVVLQVAKCCAKPRGSRGGVELAPMVKGRLPPPCSLSPAQSAEASARPPVVLGSVQPGAPYPGDP